MYMWNRFVKIKPDILDVFISMLSIRINQTNDYLGIIHENKKYQNRFKGKQLLKSVFERIRLRQLPLCWFVLIDTIMYIDVMLYKIL